MAEPSARIPLNAPGDLKPLVTLLLLILIWLSILTFPSRIAGVELDDSWQRSFGYFLKHRLQAGTDYVFTYGPLGYFASTIYDRDLFWAAFAYQLIIKSLLVYYLARLIKPEIAGFNRYAALSFLLLFLGAAHRDAEVLFLLVTIGCSLVEENIRWSNRVLSLALLSVLSLGKFLSLLFSIFVLICSEIPYRTKKIKTVFSPFILFPAIFFLFYLVAGQSILDFPRFLRSSIEIASGYNESMMIEGNYNELLLSLAIVFLLILMLFQIYWQTRTNRNESVKLLIVGTGLLLAWKQGFTRQDNHTIIFFGYAIFAIQLLILHFQYPSKKFHPTVLVYILTICTLFGTIFGFFRSPWSRSVVRTFDSKTLATSCIRRIQLSTIILLSPAQQNHRLKRQEREMERQWAFPIFASHLANSSVDILSFQQGVLLLNQFHWLPRPVFQSYSAYTPYLAERNAQFFLKETAPDYLMFKLQTLDDRVPSLDDNLALFEIISRYEPQAVERSFLLLKKKAMELRQKAEWTTIKNQQIHFNQEFSIPSGFLYQTLYLDIRETFWGELRKLFFRPAHILLTVRTRSGDSREYRLVKRTARTGFLLIPFIRNTSEFSRLFGPSPGGDVQSFTLKTDAPGLWWSDSVHMELRGTNELVQTNINSAKLAMIQDALQSDLNFDGKHPLLMLELQGGAPYGDGYRALYGNGTVVTTPQVLAKGTYKLILVGYGWPEFPNLHVYLNGKKIESFELKGNHHQVLFTTTGKEPIQFSMEFHNDAVIGNEDRNVFIKNVYVAASKDK